MLKLGYVKKLMQTRFGSSASEDKKERENSYATVIASFLGFDNPEDCYQVQEHYPVMGDEHNITWVLAFSKWIEGMGYDWGVLGGHQYDDSHYIVFGVSYRDDVHACIYNNGELWHDPHPDGTGLAEELFFEYIEPIGVILQ